MKFRAVASFVALASFAGLARAATAVPLPWDGFGVGSYVHMKTTTEMEGVPKMPGAPEMASESKQTLVKITPEAYTIKQETKTPGADWTGTEFAYPRVFDGKAPEGAPKVETEELGTEKVTVEGKAYECKKLKTKAAFGTSTTWTHDTHGLLKMETSGANDVSSTMTVEALAEKVKAGDKEVECRREKATTKSPQGEMSGVTWRSKSVPGHVVKTESANAFGAMKQKVTSVVVAFEAKPLETK